MLTWVAAVERSGGLREPPVIRAPIGARDHASGSQRGSDLDLASDPG
jgi:hypothetical protein